MFLFALNAARCTTTEEALKQPKCDFSKPVTVHDPRAGEFETDLKWVRRNCSDLPKDLRKRVTKQDYHGFAELVGVPSVRSLKFKDALSSFFIFVGLKQSSTIRQTYFRRHGLAR